MNAPANVPANGTEPGAARPAAAPTSADTLVIRRTLPAPPERVFEAWTRPHMVRRWFSPGPMRVEEAALDVRVGGAYRIVMMGAEGEPHSPGGVYEEIMPDRKLVFSWKWANSDLVTRVTVELRPVGEDQTELTLTHTGFPDAETRGLHEAGWVGCLEKLPPLVGPQRPATAPEAT